MKIRQQFETEVYVNESGDLAIKQVNDINFAYRGEEEVVVVIPRHEISALISFLTRLAADWPEDAE